MVVVNSQARRAGREVPYIDERETVARRDEIVQRLWRKAGQKIGLSELSIPQAQERYRICRSLKNEMQTR